MSGLELASSALMDETDFDFFPFNFESKVTLEEVEEEESSGLRLRELDEATEFLLEIRGSFDINNVLK